MSAATMTPTLLTVADVAERWQVSTWHVRNLVANGTLPRVPGMGQVIRIPREAVEAVERGRS